MTINCAGFGSMLYSLGADPTENTAFNISSFVVGVFTDPLPRNGRLLIHLLHSNGCARCLFQGLGLATGLYATMSIMGKKSLLFKSRSYFADILYCVAQGVRHAWFLLLLIICLRKGNIT
jgi:hypothetical protein